LAPWPSPKKDLPNVVIDFIAARVEGAIKASKARVLFHEGRLYTFNLAGEKVHDVASREPKRRKRWTGVYDAETELGAVEIAQACATCHGWWRLAVVPARRLLERV